jgi:hypothetical protein
LKLFKPADLAGLECGPRGMVFIARIGHLPFCHDDNVSDRNTSQQKDKGLVTVS